MSITESTNSLSKHGLGDRYVSLLLKVAEIRIECERKMDQIQKTKFPKITTGKNRKKERETWAKCGSFHQSLVLELIVHVP